MRTALGRPKCANTAATYRGCRLLGLRTQSELIAARYDDRTIMPDPPGNEETGNGTQTPSPWLGWRVRDGCWKRLEEGLRLFVPAPYALSGFCWCSPRRTRPELSSEQREPQDTDSISVSSVSPSDRLIDKRPPRAHGHTAGSQQGGPTCLSCFHLPFFCLIVSSALCCRLCGVIGLRQAGNSSTVRPMQTEA